MRTSLALISAIALLASPYFFAYLEAERLLGWPEAVYQWIDPWLPIAMILLISIVTTALQWIIGVFGELDHRPSNHQ